MASFICSKSSSSLSNFLDFLICIDIINAIKRETIPFISLLVFRYMIVFNIPIIALAEAIVFTNFRFSFIIPFSISIVFNPFSNSSNVQWITIYFSSL